MDEPLGKAERQRLKKMLCDAIRALCQSSVRYNDQLSFEALIGITVDGGKDSLIFTLNEVVDRHVADNEGEYYDVADDNQYIDYEHADYMEEENYVDYYDVEDGNEEQNSCGQMYMPYGTVVKEEVMSTISYNNVGRSHLPQAITTSSLPHFKTEPYAEDSWQNYDESVNQQSTGLPQSWSSHNVVSKSHTPGFGTQKPTVSANLSGAKKVNRSGSKVSQFGPMKQKLAATGKMQALSGEDAVSQITLYTCGTCGAQMSRHDCFQRHKQSHVVQQSFGCEGCGKMIRRRDNLLKHQRGCEAYLSKFP